LNPIAAIWHHPGLPPNRQGAGDYPVVIVGFIAAPTGALAIVADATGHLNAASIAELEMVDPAVKAAIAPVPARG
jgi:hypothetical protein